MDHTDFPKHKKRHELFCHNFIQHISSFMKLHDLINPKMKIILSVSGGVDSMVLVDVFKRMNLDFEILHFNHGTRVDENAREEELVRSLASSLNTPFNLHTLNLSLNDKNFESAARARRQEVYKEYLQQNCWIYTAHHIDDSFEWSLMQSFKQSSMEASVGIPVKASGIIRPFMCVTKKQLKRFARAAHLKWMEDSSNSNEKFERNFLRLNITNIVLEKYPQALAHYVSRSNEIVLKKTSDFKIVKGRDFILIDSTQLREHKNEIKKLLFTLSNKDRGEIDSELNKLFSAQELMQKDSASFPFKGPMNFSGGVTLYLIKNQLCMMNKKRLDFYKSYDEGLKNKLETLAQIPQTLKISEFPYLQFSIGKKLQKSSKYIHPLLPVTCLWLKNQNISYSYAQLTGVSDRQMLAYDALILDSSILG